MTLGFDPAREAAFLTEQERRYLLATPLQELGDAGVIAYHAGDRAGGHRFAGFARRQAWLFTKALNCYGTAYIYRLSLDGAAVRAAVETTQQDRMR